MLPLILVALIAATQATTGPQTAKDYAQPAESATAAWTILRSALDERSADKRAEATRALGLLPQSAEAERLAEKKLIDPHPDVRTEAAYALGQMRARAAIPKLRQLLSDTNVKVVVAGANALYQFKDPAAYEVYYALLTGERKSSRSLIQSQLDILKDKKQLEELIFQTGIGFVPFGSMSYEAFKTITHNDSSPVRAAAAEKLATDPDPKTTEALGRACSDSKWQVRLAVVEAIAKRGDPSLLFSVGPLLYDNNDSVRYEAAATVIRLSGRKNSARETRRRR